MDSIFPSGWGHFLAGGLLVGLGTALIFALTGIRAGASGVFTTAWSYVSRRACFQTSFCLEQRHWRSLFTVGLILGAAAFTLVVRREAFVTTVPLWRLIAGGLLVGLGTRMSRGCTSGHGICGLSAGSRSSLVAVLVFMAVAIATALGLRALGVMS